MRDMANWQPRRSSIRAARAGTAWATGLIMALAWLVGSMPACGRAQDLTQETETAVSSLNAFGLRALQRLAPESATGTVVISPLSLSVALAMTAQGADGATAAAFRTLLAGPTGTGAEEADATTARGATAALTQLAAAYEALLATLAADAPPNRFSTAQALWVAADIDLKPGFTETVSRRFDAQAETVDFGAPETPARINGWVHDKTEGLIPTLVDRLSDDLAMLLANAIAFEGTWHVPFDPDATRERPFRLPGGGERAVPMMHRTGEKMPYAEDDDAQMVRLPYQGELLALTVILPKPASSARAWLQGLTDAAALEAQLAAHRFTRREGTLALPKLDIAYSTELTATLAALGLEVAFTPGADFSAMTEDRVRLDQVLHKVALKADERGTKAAAATAVLVTRTSLVIGGPFEMIVDRPFLLALTHVPTGALLFIGVVEAPGP